MDSRTTFLIPFNSNRGRRMSHPEPFVYACVRKLFGDEENAFLADQSFPLTSRSETFNLRRPLSVTLHDALSHRAS